MILGHRLMKAGRSIGHKMGTAAYAIGHKYVPITVGAVNMALTVADTAHKVKILLTHGR